MRSGLLVTSLWLAGCGLIDSDVTNFDLTLPDKEFTVDAASWEIDEPLARTLLATSCASQPTVCASLTEVDPSPCGMSCSATCNAGTSTCDLALQISLHQAINLIMEKPELQSINDQPVVEVGIDSVTWEVKANTLNLWTPPITVYVAPISVVDPNDALAHPIGTIEPIEPGVVSSEPRQLEFTPTGRAELINIMSTFRIPFNVIAGSTIVVGKDQAIPAGKLDAVVRIRAHAGL